MIHFRSLRTAAFIIAMLAAVFILASSELSCVKRVPLTPAQNALLSVNQAVATVSAANKAMAKSVISVNQAGLIDDNLTNSILNYNQVIAHAVIAADVVQKGTASDSDKVAAVVQVFQSLKLPPDVATLIGGPQTNQMVVTLIESIRALIAGIQSVAVKGGVQ